MRRTSKGTEYALERQRTPGLYNVFADKPRHGWVRLGTVVKLAERDWEFTAFGVWFSSGKNLIGTRATLAEAAEAVVESTRPLDPAHHPPTSGKWN